MKKTLLLGLLAFAGFTANAQLPSGSQAPDFTATDINGNTHKLSDYLAAGKTVVLDVSATWCGPCWQFHSAHILANLHNTYGPWGSEEIVVLFVEGDPATSINNLNGINETGTPPTQGNWVKNTPYPIIDSAEIADLYQIAYFPTLYRICPSGIVTEMQPAATGTLATAISGDCGQINGAENHVMAEYATNLRLCDGGSEGTQPVTVKFKNNGVNTITSATLSIKKDGTVIASQPFTGLNIAPYASALVTVPDVSFTEDGAYEAELTLINGEEPALWWAKKKDLAVEEGATTSNNITVNVYTDNYPGEISWNIRNSAGDVVANGGPYQEGNDDQWGGGGPDANTTITESVTLPDGTDCYTIELVDAFGDGWSLGNTIHGVGVYNLEGHVYSIITEDLPFGNGTDTGSTFSKYSAFSTNGTLGNETFDTEAFRIYPNPTNGILNFATQETVSLTVTDMTGKTVFTAQNINNGDAVNLNTLQTGMYIAKIKGATAEKVEKIVIK